MEHRRAWRVESIYRLGIWLPLALVTGQLTNAPGPFLAVGDLGATVSIPLGYAYGSCVRLMREELGPTSST